MQIRKIFSLIILVFIAVAIVYLIAGIVKPEVISVNDILDSIHISDNKIYQLKKDKSTILYLLSMNCSHCQYQVESLINACQKFENYDVLLLFITNDESLTPIDKWPDLDSIPNIEVHEISEQYVAEIFGHGGVPRFYLFDSESRLLKTILGEVKPEFLINEMNSLFVRAQR